MILFFKSSAADAPDGQSYLLRINQSKGKSKKNIPEMKRLRFNSSSLFESFTSDALILRPFK